MRDYDYIIAGGGMAGLSLAYHLALSPLQDSRILILDRERKTTNDRTWCYWTEKPHIFDTIAYRSWEHLWFIGEGYEERIPLAPFRYQMVRGVDYYKAVESTLDRFPNIERHYGEITSLQDTREGGLVVCDGREYLGRYVFDGRLNPREFTVDEQHYHFLKQHFVGWEIETDHDVFDAEAATLFDFRTPQNNEMRFMYILPFSSRRAIVEFTLFSYHLLERSEYEQAIRDYLTNILQIDTWRILDSEDGIIPMTDQPFQRRVGKHILRIGTVGGRVKASTGFAFFRTHQDSAAIISSLVQHQHPFALPDPPARYRLFDSMLLQILYRRGDLAEPVFTRLFARNPIQRLFRFLDERGNVWENLQLMATTRWRWFLSAWWRIVVRRKI
ncbi:Lycopene cyclase protein [Spirochaeta africana DSM 8902]|uniref:Lycopene cyclase protein n=2 Tax=Spirochaeta TaxID=146 RepID=H9UIL7_SPIAZ|nr:Lycopene cyclase protein [Spirochaeta africana DSM 8902]